MDSKVVFEYNVFSNDITMKIMANDQIVFYETVTESVLEVIKEYRYFN